MVAKDGGRASVSLHVILGFVDVNLSIKQELFISFQSSVRHVWLLLPRDSVD